MFNKISLKAKLISAFASVSLILGVVAVTNAVFAKKVAEKFDYITAQNIPNLLDTFRMNLAGARTARALGQMGVDLAVGEYNQEYQDAILAERKSYQQSKESYLKTPFEPEEKVIFEKFDAAWQKALPLSEKLTAIAMKKDKARMEEYAQVFKKEYIPAYSEFKNLAKEMEEFQVKDAGRNTTEAESIDATAKTISYSISLVGFFFALLFGWFMATRLGTSLAQIVSRVDASSTEVAAASGQIAQSSTELSESSTEQAAAIQETAASVDEVSAMIKKNSENASRSQSSSRESKSATENGKAQVDSMIQSIGEISQANERIMRQVEEGNREIGDIVKVITEIGAKTKVINDIVFQTKLLSFNASVEAARAGEHGKGFAVVAEEVGNLAQMSGNAAKEITDMLEASVKKVEGIVVRTKDSVSHLVQDAKSKVDAGNGVARNCGVALDGILQSVATVDQLVGEIAHASREQATGMGEITKAMAQLDQATNQNSSVSQQTAAASEQLSNQAREMNGLVRELNALLRGEGQGSVDQAVNYRAAKPKEGAKVLKMVPANRTVSHARPVAFKAASGSDIPAASDPRFEDV